MSLNRLWSSFMCPAVTFECLNSRGHDQSAEKQNHCQDFTGAVCQYPTALCSHHFSLTPTSEHCFNSRTRRKHFSLCVPEQCWAKVLYKEEESWYCQYTRAPFCVHRKTPGETMWTLTIKIKSHKLCGNINAMYNVQHSLLLFGNTW